MFRQLSEGARAMRLNTGIAAIATVLMLVFIIVGFALAQSATTRTAEVRINVRQLPDGRSEFALQQRDGDSWGERMLVPQRFVAQDVGHTRWIVSVPFLIEIDTRATAEDDELMEVGGDASVSTPPVQVDHIDEQPPGAQDANSVNEVFRLGARRLEDGRVEVFAEHWDGEQWVIHAPSRRFLPADHAVDAWHRSDLFTVSVPIPSQSSVAAAPESSVEITPSVSPPDDWGWQWTDPVPLGGWMGGSVLANGWWTLKTGASEGSDVWLACWPDSKQVWSRTHGSTSEWLSVTASRAVKIAGTARAAARRTDLLDGLTNVCKLDPAAVGAASTVESERTGPPDGQPFESSPLAVTGNWASTEAEGGWSVWQMHRADGPDAYAACRPEQGALHARTHGGAWSATTVAGLREQFDFAPWYFVDHIMEDIGKSCGVHAPALGPPGQQQEVATEPEPEPRPEIPVVGGSTTMSDSRHPLLPGAERIVISWSSNNPELWSAKIRIVSLSRNPIQGRHSLAPGVVPVSVGGRTFNFMVPAHSASGQLASLRNGVWSADSEATLSGSAARDFYCAAKGRTLNFVVSMNSRSDPSRSVTVHIREIERYEEIVDAHAQLSC